MLVECGVRPFNVPIEIADAARVRWAAVDALADAGAKYTTLPSALLRDLRIIAVERRPFALRDGGTVEREVGRTWVRVEGREVMTLVVFGEEGVAAMLGAATLEEAGLAVDPEEQRLIDLGEL